ncbi:ABC transporter substrate-binding protein [Aquabacter sp. CN5-332]|uniref:ABC transporter substrate-binding protein n=1 Tax=Aquabacter sp. CN5-332 TaxID=3156608 RepID=UPI0032B3F2EC
MALASPAFEGTSGHAQVETRLNLMVFQGMQNLPLFAAQAKGFFARRNLVVDVKIAPNSDELRNGLAEGRYQIVHTAVDNGVAMSDMAKVDIAAVIGGDDSFNHFYVQPDIASIADLKGKTVIVDALNTAYAFQVYEVMKRNGLAKGDYGVKPVGATFKRLEAMEQDKEDKASTLNPPFSIRADKAGLKDTGSIVKMIGPYQATAGMVLRTWAKENEDTLVRYLQAYIEGLRWGLDPANAEETTTLLADGLKLPPDVAAAGYAIVADPKTGLTKDAAFDIEGFKNVLKLRTDWTGQPTGPVETYVDLSYYQKALAGL